MRRGRIPTYRLHKASGQAIVTLNGQDIYLGPHGSRVSRQEYDRVVGEWLARDRRLASQDQDEATTVNQVILRYAKFAERYYVRDGKPTKEFSPIKQVLKVVRHLYGRTPASQFGPLALKACRERFIAAGQSRQKINQNTGRIRRMFKWAVENELVPATVLQGLQAVSGLRMGRTDADESRPVRPVPEEHVEAVLSHALPVVSAMIRVHLLTGMRPGELVRMRGDEIDDSGSIWIYEPEKHKTAHHGHVRAVHLGPRAQWILRPYIEEADGGFLFSPRRSEEMRNADRKRRRRSPMTPSQRARKRKAKPKRLPGEHYDTASYRRAVARACEKAGVPKWNPNQLRHNAATNIRKEFGIEAARVVLGHRSALVTEIYAEIDRGKAAEVMERVG